MESPENKTHQRRVWNVLSPPSDCKEKPTGLKVVLKGQMFERLLHASTVARLGRFCPGCSMLAHPSLAGFSSHGGRTALECPCSWQGSSQCPRQMQSPFTRDPGAKDKMLHVGFAIGARCRAEALMCPVSSDPHVSPLTRASLLLFHRQGS